MIRHPVLLAALVVGGCAVMTDDGSGTYARSEPVSGGEAQSGGSAGVTATGPPATGPTATGPSGMGQTAAPTGPGGTGDKRQDAQSLHQAAERLRALGNRSEWTLAENHSPSIGQVMGWLTTTLAKQEEAQRVAAEPRAVLEALRARYANGAGGDESDALFQQFEALDVQQVMTDYQAIKNILGWIDQAAPANARRCVQVLRMSGTDRSYLQGVNEMLRARGVAEAREMLEVCPRFQPGNAQIDADLSQLRPQVEQVLTEFRDAEMAAARARNWEPSIGSVSSGSPAQLARVGLDFLRGHENWGRNTSRGVQVLGATVRGDWFVAERNIIGQPIKFGLPVTVAVRANGVLEGLARVYQLSLITTSAQQSPPFGGYWVGDSWQILAERVR